MSRAERNHKVAAIGFAISRWQEAVESFDSAVADVYGLSAAERRCIDLVCYGPQPASVIAKAINLTPAAITALIDRLEARGFVQRQSDPNDRRKVLVAAAQETRALVAHAYQPVYEAGATLLARYSIEQMDLILTFIEAVEVMQKAQLERLRAQAAGEPRQPPRS